MTRWPNGPARSGTGPLITNTSTGTAIGIATGNATGNAAGNAAGNATDKPRTSAAAPHDAARAMLIVHTTTGVPRVVHGCAVASASGVRREMTLAEARALLPDHTVHIEPLDAPRDEAALRALAVWALRFSPVVTPDPPDGLLLDISGCERLYRGEHRLLKIVERATRALGLHVRLAVAPTFGAAWGIARYGPEPVTIVPEGTPRDALEALPIEALRIDAEIVDALHEVAIDRIEHVLALPRQELWSRFGRTLLQRLDQARGLAAETIEPIRTIPRPRVERQFDGPVRRLEAIMLTVEHLVGELVDILRGQERGVRRLHLIVERADADPIDLQIPLSRPSRNERHLWALLRPRIEALHMGFGVERIELTASSAIIMRHEQAARWRESDETSAQLDEALGEFVDALGERIGAHRAVRIEPVESHVPERAFRPIPVLDAASRRTKNTRPSRSGTDTALPPPERPSRLLSRPEPITVVALAPDGPPSLFRRGSVSRALVSVYGPERVGGEWWRHGSPCERDPSKASHDDQGTEHERCEGTRDYYRVQDDTGTWWWVYRELQSGRWFVHGEWA